MSAYIPLGGAQPGETVIYSRYSSDEQIATSIDDQVASCQSAAGLIGWKPTRVIRDDAFSVKDRIAPNCERMLDEIRRKEVRRVIVDEFSRLTRDLQHLLHIQAVCRHYGASVYSVHERIDLTDECADLHIIFGGYKNQAASRDARHRVKRSMDGNLRRKLSNGDLTFGYESSSLTAQEVLDRGLPPRPPEKGAYRKLVIKDADARVVREIHRRFGVEKMSIRAITRWLNTSKVARGGKARTTRWQPIDVRKILGSRRYLGFRWRNETMMVRNPDTGRIEVMLQPASERLEIHDPELVILDQDTWEITEARFEEVHQVHPTGARGWKRKAGSVRDYFPKHPFSGLLVCGVCGTKLSQTAGHQGGYYGCPNAGLGLCSNKATANRPLTERLLLEAIFAEIGEEVVVDLVHDLLIHELEQRRTAQPDEARESQKQLDSVDRELQNLTAAIAAGGDVNTLVAAVREREHQKELLERKLDQARRQAARPSPAPDRSWVERQIRDQLPSLLGDAAPRAAAILRDITGSILVYPEKKPWLRQSHLVARMNLDLAAACGSAAKAADPCSDPPDARGFGVEVDVELRKSPIYELHATEVVRLHDKDEQSFRAIARRLPGDMNAGTVKHAYNFGKYGTPDPGDRAWKNHCRRLDARRRR